MPKFSVTIEARQFHRVEVNAAHSEDAKRIALYNTEWATTPVAGHDVQVYDIEEVAGFGSYSENDEDRIDVIGQNGNDGLHYNQGEQDE